VHVVLDQGDDFESRYNDLVDAALEHEADDFEKQNETDEGVEIQFICPPPALAKLTAALTAPGMSRELLTSELIYAPSDKSEVSDEVLENRVGELVSELEENEDTMRVWTTLDT